MKKAPKILVAAMSFLALMLTGCSCGNNTWEPPKIDPSSVQSIDVSNLYSYYKVAGGELSREDFYVRMDSLDFKNLYYTVANPSASFGSDGDLFVNVESFDIFYKIEGQWRKVANALSWKSPTPASSSQESRSQEQESEVSSEPSEQSQEPQPSSSSSEPVSSSISSIPSEETSSSSSKEMTVFVVFDYGYDDKKETKYIPMDTRVSAPKNPERDGYRFVRWLADNGVPWSFLSTVHTSMVLHAEWKAIEYGVYFVNDDETSLYYTTAYYGDSVTYPYENPTKANVEPGYVYEFAGWDGDTTSITGETIFTAQYRVVSEPVHYVFLDDDGVTKLYEENVVVDGTPEALDYQPAKSPTTDGEPEAAGESGTQYSFKEWKQLSATESEVVYQAVYESCDAGIQFIDDYNGGWKVSYRGTKKEVVIPASWKGKAVTAIAGYGFDENSSVTSISLPDSLTSIEDHAFYRCISLTSIDIPETVTSIDDAAFYGCSALASIRLPSGLTYLDDYLFEYCSSLTTINIPTSVKSIAGYAFYQCTSLTSIFIPEAVTNIGYYAFGYCNSLERAYFAAGSKDGIDINKSGNDKLFSKAVYYSETNPGDFPATHWHYNDGAPSLWSDLFEVVFKDDDGNELAKVEVHYGEAAVYPNANPIKLSDESGAYVFAGWDKLLFPISADMEVTAQYQKVQGVKAAYYNYDGTLLLETLLPSAESDAATYFTGDEPAKPDELEINMQYGFVGWEKSVALDESLIFTAQFDKSTRGLIFDGGRVKQYVGTSKIVYIPRHYNGYDITSIGLQAFEDRAVTEVYLPDNLEAIGDKAFYNCDTLEQIHVGKGLVSIGQSAFFHCSSLNGFAFNDTMDSVGQYAFKGCTSLSIVQMKKIDTIGRGAFEGCTGITDVDIQEIEELNWEAFLNCTNITSVVVMKADEIGSEAFKGCSSLLSAYVGKANSIGSGAFYSCNKITEIYLPFIGGSPTENRTLRYIFNGSFGVPSSLTSVILSDDCTSIGDNACSGCKYIVSIELGSGITSIGNSAFADCSALTVLFIAGPMKTVGSKAFENCSKLRFVFNKEAMKPGSYQAGWYGSAKAYYGFERLETDVDYNYYYINELGYKKVLITNLDNTKITDGSSLPKFIGEYEVIFE